MAGITKVLTKKPPKGGLHASWRGVYVSDETKRDLVLSAIGGETDAGEAQDHKSPGCGFRYGRDPQFVQAIHIGAAAGGVCGRYAGRQELKVAKVSRVQRGKKLP